MESKAGANVANPVGISENVSPITRLAHKEDNKKLDDSLELSIPVRKYSSSSLDSQFDKELKFEDVELNLGDASLSFNRKRKSRRLAKLFSQIEQSSMDPRTPRKEARTDDGWAGLFADNTAKKTATKTTTETTHVRIFDLASMSYLTNPSKESAINEYKNGKELVVEITNYKVDDVTYLIRELNLNAILCWEILEEQSPDKFEKFGSRTFFMFLNFLTIESISSSNQHTVKIVKIPRLILLFNSGKFDFNDLAPRSIENLTSDKIMFLVLQYSMQQVEDVLGALKVHASEIYSQAHDAHNPSKTKVAFVQDVGRISTLILSLQQQIHRKKVLFSEVTRERSVFPLLRYLVRHLHGRLRYCKAEIEDMNLLLDVTQSTYTASMDQKVSEYNHNLNNMTRVLSTITAVYGPLCVLSGIMGMNVKLPGQHDDSYVPFIIIIAISIGVCTIMLLFFKYVWGK